MNFIGVDIGTTTVKVAVFDQKGNILSSTSREKEIDADKSSSGPSLSQDFYWDNARKAMAKAVSKLEKKEVKKIKALSVSSHTDTLFSVDGKGNDVAPVIPWLNSIGQEEKEEVLKNFDIESMFKVTGQPEPSNVFFGIRLLWLKKQYPASFKKVWKFMQVMDFILYKLTGEVVGEPTVYDGSYIFNINDRDYYKPMLDFIGIDREKLPRIAGSGTSLGKIDKEVAADIGLPKDLEIIVGAMDQNCSSLGAGNFSRKVATVTIGTVLAVMVNIDRPVYDIKTRIPVYNQLFDDNYCLLPWSPLGGIFLKWFKDRFMGKNLQDKRFSDTYKLMDQEAAGVGPGCEGLITLPFISGVLTPFNNHKAKGIFFGIETKHERGHFIRSILESNAYMLRLYLDLFKKMGIGIKEMRVLGGGAKSELWSQIKADITGTEVKTLKNPDSSLLGAAMIAAVGSGFYKDYKEACNNMVKLGSIYEPCSEHRSTYEENYNKFLKLYNNNKELF
ncbi:MAG: xylulokinase [Actinomycetota bacterium]